MTTPNTFHEAHARVCELIADFAAREFFYLSSEYQEAEARTDFIDKFWIALGWDVRHERQKNPYEQDVKVERGVQVGLAQKKADYAFHLAPNWRDPRFFCEAKKPSVKIREDRDAHFQTHSYGWNSGTPLSVLMDFQELVIVDCRRKPHIDAALTAAHRSYEYRQFEDAQKFGEIYWLFSREAVAAGKLAAYIAGLPKPGKGGKQPGLLRAGDTRAVDAAFLDDLESHRADLARMLKNRNPQLDGDTLTELVQRILDRLVFLRFLEDKLIETEHRVQDFGRAAAGQSWVKFLAASRRLDARYNGVVFKRHDLLDGGTLAVDGGDFADVCEKLLYVNNGCLFSYIPIHVLGSIYERFLGTVIVTTDKRARPEQKPEVRKAGGVYYTPEYIVRYICEQTVGKLIEGKTPAQIEKLRFADIACGSGSFLLGVFDLLLRYHGRWYAAHPAEAKDENLAPATKNKKKRKNFIPAVVEREGLFCLTLEKKRQILLNNIYGVDLDPQAVEVAQLSLYLKLLEDETTASTRDDYLDFHEALLPPLSGNIKRGNSLVGTEILLGQFEFSTREERKLCPMNFEDAFPHIFGPKWGETRVREMDDGYHVNVDFEPRREAVDDADRAPVKPEKVKPPVQRGGFDALVGNPPYDVVEKERGEASWPHDRLLEYVRGGTRYANALGGKLNLFRFFLVRALSLMKPDARFGMIVPMSILADISCASTRKYLLEMTRDFSADCFPQKDDPKRRIFDEAKLSTVILCASRQVHQAADPEIALRVFPGRSFDEPFRSCTVRFSEAALLDADNIPIPLVSTEQWQLCQRIHRHPSVTRLGALPDFNVTRGEINQTIYREFITANPKDSRLVKGVEIARYRQREKLSQGKREWFEERRYLAAFPNRQPFPHARIATQRITGVDERLRIVAAIIRPIAYFADSTNSVSVAENSPCRLGYLLAILNSRLMQWRFKLTSSNNNVGTNELDCLPVRKLDFTDSAERALHDRLVQMTEAMSKAKAEVPTAKTDSDRTYLEDKCAGLDQQIDQFVYELYDLTEEEIALVEGTC